MAQIVFFDNEGRVEEVGAGNTPDFYEKNVAINPPSISALTAAGLLRKYWKKIIIARHKNAQNNWTMNDVAEMWPAEKDAVDAEIQAVIDAAKEAQKDIDKLEKAVRVLAILTFKEINKLRVKDGDQEYTWAQFKQAFKNEWNLIGG